MNNLGSVLSKIPVSPKYGKMLLASHKYPGLFVYTVMMVACMSVPEVYTTSSLTVQVEEDEDEEAQ
jgi:HrpA-like RNA helicase